MNELNGRFVIIVLSIKEGRGFDFLQSPMYVEATLKGSKIESDPAQPDSNPDFSTELVWETEKKEVRKLRCSHVPLRVECFTVSEDQRREKIGFVLLSLRSAQAITSDQAPNLEHKWHKLLGVPQEYKVSHPELALTLTVRDRMSTDRTAPKPQPPQTWTPLIEQIIPEEAASQGDAKPLVIPIMYLEQGLIQIGENSGSHDKFTLSFLINTAFNLDLLLPESKVFNNTSDKYFLSMSVLGLTITTKYFFKGLHEPVLLNDRVLFKLQSNMEILKLFFDQYQSIPVSFNHGTDMLGAADIDLKNFLSDQSLDVNRSVYKCEQSCVFRSAESGLVPEGVDGRKPFVSTETVLERGYCHSQNNANTELVTMEEVSRYTSLEKETDSLEDINKASGDQPQPEAKTSSSIKPMAAPIITLPMEDASVQTTPRDSKIDKSALTVLKNVTKEPKSKFNMMTSFDDVENYRLYSLTAVFLSITWRQSMDINGFQFKFQHPRANNVLQIHCNGDNVRAGEIIALEDVNCTVYFISTENNIKSLISMYSPKISICTLEGHKITEEFKLYTRLFTSQNSFQCSYFAVLNREFNDEDILCDLQIQMKLTDHGSNLLLDIEPSDFDLAPLVLDDRLALKTLNELKEWQGKQEELFAVQLKRLETEKLAILQADWTKKRGELESKLQHGMEKCRVLSQELSLAANEMKIRKMKYEERNAMFGGEIITDANIEVRVTQMLEEEMNKKVERIQNEKKCLTDEIEILKKDKETLIQSIQMLEKELEDIRRTTLTKEQTACLLQELRCLEEKHQQAHNAKTFFKEQWQKALKEVHALKSEDQRQMQQDIRKKKEELSQLSLDDLDKLSDRAEEDESVSANSLDYARNTDYRSAFIY